MKQRSDTAIEIVTAPCFECGVQVGPENLGYEDNEIIVCKGCYSNTAAECEGFEHLDEKPSCPGCAKLTAEVDKLKKDNALLLQDEELNDEETQMLHDTIDNFTAEKDIYLDRFNEEHDRFVNFRGGVEGCLEEMKALVYKNKLAIERLEEVLK